jgi:hypothetical protein
MSFPRIMDRPAIAQLLGISKQAVQSLDKRGKLPEPVAELAIGRIWLADDIEAWARDTGRLSESSAVTASQHPGGG